MPICYSAFMETKTPQRTTLLLDPELHKRLKILAVEQGTTFTALVDEALRAYLERTAGGRPAGRRKRS